MPLPYHSKKQKYTVSFFGTVATAAAFIIYLFSSTWPTEDLTSFITMTLILIAGVVLAGFMVGLQFMPFSFKTLVTDCISTVGSVMALMYVNSMVLPTNLGVSPISQQSFLILSGVAEEWFFRQWLCAWVHNVMGRTWMGLMVAVSASSAVWAWFHLSRYGYDMGLIWLVFLAGLPLGFLTIYFKSADGPMFGHMVINALV